VGNLKKRSIIILGAGVMQIPMIKKAGLMLVAFLAVAAVLGFVVSRPFGSTSAIFLGSGSAQRERGMR